MLSPTIQVKQFKTYVFLPSFPTNSNQFPNTLNLTSLSVQLAFYEVPVSWGMPTLSQLFFSTKIRYPLLG